MPNMWFSLTRDNNSFLILSNNGNPITIKLGYKDSCSNDIISLNTYTTDTSIVLNLPINDNLYILEIINNIGESYKIEIPKYNTLLKSLIEDIELVLCDCGCKHCDDCKESNNKDYISTLLKLISFYTLNKQYFQAYLDIVFECTKCNILDASQCILINEKVYGNADNTRLLKEIISSFYIAFYYGSTQDYKSLFNYSTTYSCIKNIGIDLSCIENKIKNMATVNMITDAYINKPPTRVGDITLNATNRTPTVYSLASFTGVFADPENDPLQAIRVDTLPVHGQLMYDTTGSGNWALVTAGQVILASDITAGRFKFVPPDQNALDNTSWNYSARDSGSMQFVS